MPYWHFWMPYISCWNIYRDTPNSNYYEQIKIIRWFNWRNKRETRFLTPDVRRFNDFSTTDTVKITAKFAPAVPREILPGAWARQDLCAIVSPGIMHSNCAPEEGRKEERENKKKRKKKTESARSHDRSGGKEKSSWLSGQKRGLRECSSRVYARTRASRESWIWKKKRRNVWQMWSRRKMCSFSANIVSTKSEYQQNRVL